MEDTGHRIPGIVRDRLCGPAGLDTAATGVIGRQTTVRRGPCARRAQCARRRIVLRGRGRPTTGTGRELQGRDHRARARRTTGIGRELRERGHRARIRRITETGRELRGRGRLTMETGRELQERDRPTTGQAHRDHNLGPSLNLRVRRNRDGRRNNSGHRSKRGRSRGPLRRTEILSRGRTRRSTLSLGLPLSKPNY
jgi:hypothetical protein